MTEQYPSDNYETLPKQDKFYCLAHKAIKGEEDKIVYCLEDDKFYLYENGIWTGMFDVQLMSILGRKIPELYKYSSTTRKQILDNLKLIRHINITTFNQIDFLNFKNCMINPYSAEILDHDPMYMSTTQIEYAFDSTAKCDLWLKTIDEILEGDDRKKSSLQEFFGYCLTRDVRMEKAMLLLGDSRSGKSTILNTLKNMIGDKNVSTVSLKNITNPQYTDMMVGKLVNIDSDVSSKASEFEEEFKKITSGESISCNQKYVKAFTFNPFCKIVLSANDFPRITDHSSAFYKRLILIPCDRVFEPHEQNINLRNQLLQELPGILNWSLEGLKRLHVRKGFEINEFMREAIDELREESNPVDVFFNEHVSVIVADNIEIEKSEFYNKYKSWAMANNHGVMSSSKFSQHVFRKYAKSTFKNSRNMNNQKRVWKNLLYVDNKILNKNQGWKQ